MTTTLIVLAHPDKRSFNGAWASATEHAARAEGGTVLLSDLCAMGFDPVESVVHYPDAQGTGSFDPLKSQEKAARNRQLPHDVQAEIDKLLQADRVVFHFPLWWFGPPAILKGWFDRVLANGALHDVDRRFDTGLLCGKKALFCVTTGSSAAESAYNGKEGDVRMLLWPAAYTLRYLGFSVLQPVTVHGVHGYHKGAAEAELRSGLQTVLADQERLIAEFDNRPCLTFNADSDFDCSGRLHPDSPSHSLFIRQSDP